MFRLPKFKRSSILLLLSLWSSAVEARMKLHFGTVAAIKEEGSELALEKEERLNSEALKIRRAFTDAAGKAMFYDYLKQQPITIKVIDKAKSSPIGGVEVRYINTGSHVFCEVRDAGNHYQPTFHVITNNGHLQSPRFFVVDDAILITIGLSEIVDGLITAYTILDVGKTIWDDIPSFRLVNEDGVFTHICADGKIDYIKNLEAFKNAALLYFKVPALIQGTRTPHDAILSVTDFLSDKADSAQYGLVDAKSEYTVCWNIINSDFFGPLFFESVKKPDYQLHVSITPIDPDAKENVLVRASIEPAKSNLSVILDVHGSDGCSRQQSKLTDGDGVVQFERIPGGKPGVTDQITISVSELNLNFTKSVVY